jgi:two-component system, NarL family, sensor histidine kinase UhpB
LRTRLLRLVWFGRSVRTQIVIVFVAINIIAAVIAGGITVYKAGTSTRREIAASTVLAELMANEAVQLIQQGVPAERILKALPRQLRFARHVRIGVRDAQGIPVADRIADPAGGQERSTAPAWFARLISPPIEYHDVPVVIDGHTIGTVEIISEPRDEIAEVWENATALAPIAAGTILLVIGILYLALGRVLDPLRTLAAALQRLEWRDYRLRLARPAVFEFAAIADRFNALAGALEEARNENLALSRRLITAQDDERRRTALELHDEVGPSLFGLKANAASIARAASALPPAERTTIAERVRDLTAIIDHLQGINRAILNRLRPMALGHMPLPQLLAELVHDCARQHGNLSFTCDFAGIEETYGDTADLTLYRCLQESLTNAIRHAGAKSIRARVAVLCGGPGEANESGTRLGLTVHDDGCGIAVGIPQGFGLRGMRERVQALGGDFALDSGPGGGTCVRINIPVTIPQEVLAHPVAQAAGS